MQNRLLAALPPEDYGLVAPHLTHMDLERGRLLYEPGDRMDVVYFPHDGVISLMTLMENGAAIESAAIGREGAVGLTAAVAPRQSLSRAVVQTHCRCSRIGANQLHEAWVKSPRIREMIDRHAGAAAVDRAAIAGGMTTMLDDGIAKCRAGITSPAEVLRVTTVR